MSAFEQIMIQFNNALPQWQAIGLDLAKQLFIISEPYNVTDDK